MTPKWLNSSSIFNKMMVENLSVSTRRYLVHKKLEIQYLSYFLIGFSFAAIRWNLKINWWLKKNNNTKIVVYKPSLDYGFTFLFLLFLLFYLFYFFFKILFYYIDYLYYNCVKYSCRIFVCFRWHVGPKIFRKLNTVDMILHWYSLYIFMLLQ